MVEEGSTQLIEQIWILGLCNLLLDSYVRIKRDVYVRSARTLAVMLGDPYCLAVLPASMLMNVRKLLKE